MEAVARGIQRLVDIALGVEPVELLIQIASTALLIIVVKVFFWDKVTAFLDARRESINNELTEASEKNENAQTMQEEAEQELEEARASSKKMVEEAKSRSEDIRRNMIAEAKDEASRIKKEARKDLEKEMDLARNKMRNEIIEIASLLTYKAIQKQISEETYDKLIDEAIKEVRKQ